MVTVNSVFCRTSDPLDGEKTLMSAPTTHYYTRDFNHFNLGTDGYRINTFIDKITQGLSDWTVSKIADSTFIEPDINNAGYAWFEINAEYNAQHKDIVGIVVVIYAKDIAGNWHIISQGNNGANAERDINKDTSKKTTAYFKEILNSKDRPVPLELEASCNFPASDPSDPNHIKSVTYAVIPLKFGQDTVNPTPEGGFGLPGVGTP